MILSYPQITFKVGTIDMHSIVSNPQPDSNLENIINNLKNQTIWVPFVDKPLKHGDEFTLYGKEAMHVFNIFKKNLCPHGEIIYFGIPKSNEKE